MLKIPRRHCHRPSTEHGYCRDTARDRTRECRVAGLAVENREGTIKSGNGREGSKYGIEDYLEIKQVALMMLG